MRAESFDLWCGWLQGIRPSFIFTLRAHTHPPTAGYLCSLEDNLYGIEFTGFSLCDMESGMVLFEVKQPSGTDAHGNREPSRCVRYHFPPEFLQLKTIGAT